MIALETIIALPIFLKYNIFEEQEASLTETLSSNVTRILEGLLKVS